MEWLRVGNCVYERVFCDTWLSEQIPAEVQRLGLSPEDLEAVLHVNALRLLQ
jgi:hypothetical protein